MKIFPGLTAAARARQRLIAAALCLGPSLALAAQPVGTIIKLSGPLSAKKTDGSVKALVVGSDIEPGDILTTGEKSYALIRFIDKSEITLRPRTTFQINASAEKMAKQPSR